VNVFLQPGAPITTANQGADYALILSGNEVIGIAPLKAPERRRE